MTKIIAIFDIDGTLIDARGAGHRAMRQAFREVLGEPDALNRADFAGRTDWPLFWEAAVHTRVPTALIDWAAVQAAYFSQLSTELANSPPTVLPGVGELLFALAASKHFLLRLGTGNFYRSACLKLSAVGLWRYFPQGGGFADDGPDRPAILRAARRTAPAATHAVVIGDTPYDVEAAHAESLACLAVATGRFSADQLSRSGADTVLESLSDPNSVMSQLVAMATPCAGPY